MAEKVILSTKIQHPLLRPKHIKRERIERKLGEDLLSNNTFTRKLSLISAPAGYGKTTLAVSWLQDLRPAERCWLSIDESDNDPVVFLTYLITALQSAIPGIGKSVLGMLQNPIMPPNELLLTPLINEIAAFGKAIILALDDYHLIHQIDVHNLMDFLIQHLPVNLHIVIISREDPPFPLHALRAKNLLSEVRQKDLAFSNDEANDFLKTAFQDTLSEHEVKLITQRTEGWISGIQLTALSLNNRPNPQSFIADFNRSNRFILDYLFEEIFLALDEQTRDFLLKISVLNKFCLPIAEAVTGLDDCSRIIEEITQSNLFLSSLDENYSWFRFHRLFLELLRQQLRKDLRDVIPALHLEASNWYAENDHLEDSIHHALEGKQWGVAAERIGAVSDYLLKNGRISTLLTYLRKIPGEIIKSSRDLCLTFAWPLLLTNQLSEAESYIQAAETVSDSKSDSIGQIAAAWAYLAQARGEQEELIRRSEEALSLLPKGDQSSRSIIALNLGIAYWHLGLMEKAMTALTESLPGAVQSGNIYAEISAKLFLARIDAVKGKLALAAQKIGGIVARGSNIPITHLALTDLALIHYEWDELDKALEIIIEACEKMERGGNREFELAGLMIQMRILGAMKNNGEFDRIYRKCDAFIQAFEMSPALLSRWAAFNIELRLTENKIDQAKEWLEQISVEQDAHPFYRFLHLSSIRISLAENNVKESRKLLVKNLDEAIDKEWKYGSVWLLTRLALVSETDDAAAEFLSQALEIGNDGKLLRTFIEAGPGLLPALAQNAKNFRNPGYIKTIINAVGKLTTSSTSEDLIDPPSEREMEILRLIAAGMTNAQIAQQLIISVSTVKSHVHHICAKLNAANRTQAVAKARDIGLIS